MKAELVGPGFTKMNDHVPLSSGLEGVRLLGNSCTHCLDSFALGEAKVHIKILLFAKMEIRFLNCYLSLFG